tara:strand:+ start:1200 stop:2102 length:903 start_codon:yes stop_codon:yes gene_type:complete
MKRPYLYIILVLMFSLFTSYSFGVSFEKNCKVPKGSIKIIKINGEKYNQFTLKDKDKGGCSTDAKSRHGYPYWERVEYAQVNTLSKKKNHEINFKVKILKGFLGQRETFFQIHNYNKNLLAVYPSIMLKFHPKKTNECTGCSNYSTRTINCFNKDGQPKKQCWIEGKGAEKGKWIEGGSYSKSISFFQIDYLKDFLCLDKKNNYCAKSKGGHEEKKFQSITIKDFSKKWMNFKILISKIINEKGFVTIIINDNIILDNVIVHFPKGGTPRIKYGIYRPGNLQGNNTSQILYSKINVNSKK